MRKFLEPLSPGAEFLVVMTVAFGLFIVRSLYIAVHPGGGPLHTGASLLRLTAYELVVLVILGAFLWRRGWTLARLGLKPTLADTAIGIVLALTAYVSYAAAWMAMAALTPQLARAAAHTAVITPGLSPLVVALNVIVNPLFEEVFVSGYAITALKDSRGEAFAVNASVATRLLYYLYQGVRGVLAAVPIGLIFAIWYVRTGRLWPLIVAHAVLDLMALAPMVRV